MRPARAHRRLALLVGIVLLLTSGGLPLGAPPERRAVIFYTGAIHGVLEPCGCTSDPLGDIARVTGAIRRAEKDTGAVLVVDAGNTLYAADGVPVSKRKAADLRAAFLSSQLGKLPFAGSALGPSDIEGAGGADKVSPRRLAANIPTASFTEPSRLLSIGGIKIGILGLASPRLLEPYGIKAEDPGRAAEREARRLRAEGAEIVIALAALDRAESRRLGRDAAVDFIVVGQDVGDGLRRADKAGNAYLVAPAAELQRIGRIDLVLRGAAAKGQQVALVDAGGEEAAKSRLQEIGAAVQSLDAELARWVKDPSADPAFVAGKKKERDELATERARLQAGKWQPPATGSYFTNQLIAMRRALPRDPGLQAAMRRLDAAVGKVNLAEARPPPKAEPGRAVYVGDKACAKCHRAATAYWKTTVHAHAWKTLVDGGKAADHDCVSCHVTGYGEVGGSSLGFTKRLESVQCETCHGPSSLHVAAEGLDEPLTIHSETPQSTCVRCHNEKHSDTFDYNAYLRDILGRGHGLKAREALGPGPTGHELRSAAIARAKSDR